MVNYTKISRSTVNSIFSDSIVVEANPQSINKVTTSFQKTGEIAKSIYSMPKFFQGRLTGFLASRILLSEPFFFKRYATTPTSIDNEKRFIFVSNLMDNKDRYKNSLWYKHLSKKILTKGVALHKNITLSSLSDLDSFFVYILSMAHDIQNKGYDVRSHKVESGILIDDNFNIIKASHGNHRFFIAKSLGVKKFPFVIEGVHIDIYKQYVENHGVGKPKDFDHFHNFLKYITENINRD